jgi:uncharacterized protein YciI
VHWLLFYDHLVDDYVERRQPFREEHLAMVFAARDRGELLIAGALSEPADGAVLVWYAEDPAVIERFVADDPYVRNGLVGSWRIRRWTVVT